jgi:hypothetical protein
MIEIIFDFEGIKTEYELFRMAYIKILNIDMPKNPINGKYAVWDAFRDDFSDIFDKVPDDDYVYKDNDEWGWADYRDYKECVEEWSKIGPKDENGKKGDMKLVFKNFYPFLKKHTTIATTFLEIILRWVHPSNMPLKEGEFKDWYSMTVCIEG